MEYTLLEKYELIKQEIIKQDSKNPIDIVKKIMHKDYISIHGPEHHYLDGAAFMIAYKNAGGNIDIENGLQELENRTIKMPSAMCGQWGVCGSVASLGAVLSIIHNVGPLSNTEYYADDMSFTSTVLNKMSEIGGPRCCKRNAFISISYAIDFVYEKYGIKMEKENIECEFSDKNLQCIKDRCPFHNKNISLDTKGFVLLTDVIKDVMLDMRYYSTFNFVGERIDGYQEDVAILTLPAANALKKVASDAKALGYRLKIFDAYRPQMAVDHFIRWAKEVDNISTKEYFYPNLNKEKLFELGFVAKKSSHSRGSTVDLTLFDMKTQKDLDMGGTFDYFGDISYSDCLQGLTLQQINNRKLLKDLMINNGFLPYKEEWWHFTLDNEPYKDIYFNFPVSSKIFK